MRPLIFLDFDGVLLSGRLSYKLDSECVANLNTLLYVTGACVIVTSAWRGKYVAPMRRLLQQWGVVPISRIIGITPDLWLSTDPLKVGCGRGDEIAAWRDAHPMDGGPFVILDDEDDMAHLQPFLVQTDTEQGLTRRDIDRAIQLLAEQRAYL